MGGKGGVGVWMGGCLVVGGLGCVRGFSCLCGVWLDVRVGRMQQAGME